MYNQNQLLALSQRAFARTKQASEEAIPTAFGNHGSGMVNPDPSQARMSIMGEMRSAANRQNYLDGQIQGTNLIPYKGTISERYQTISNAINNIPMGGDMMAKTASEEEQEFIHEMSNKVVEIDGQLVPLFDNFIPDSRGMYNQMVDNTLSKTASETNMVIANLIQNGQVPVELIPYLQ